VALHVLVQAFEELLSFVRLLARQDDKIVVLWVWQQHIQIWRLLLSRHVPCNSEDLDVLAAREELCIDVQALKMDQSTKIRIELIQELLVSVLSS